MVSLSLSRLDWLSWRTPFVFFTGKGGVGKTTIASAAAVALSDAGQRVLLVSTDPASNLADVLGTAVAPEPQPVPGVAGLEVMKPRPGRRGVRVSRACDRAVPGRRLGR